MRDLEKPWISKHWIGSHFDFATEVRSGMNLPEKIEILDTTLRDGTLQAGLALSKDNKVQIAQALDELGINRIEAGGEDWAEDFDAIKEIANAGLKHPVFAFTTVQDGKEKMDLCLRTDVSGVVLDVPASDILINGALHWSREQLIENSVGLASYAKDHGLYVTFFSYDTTRSNPAFLKRLVTAAQNQAKADSVSVVDTFGIASPFSVGYIVRTMRKWVNLPIEAHMHNDLGLATANSLAAVAAGAEVVHTTVGGIGYRSGGTPTEEAIVALRMILGANLDIDYSKIFNVCRLVQDLAGWQVSTIKPVIGERAFGVETDGLIAFLEEFKKSRELKSALPYLPEFVGNKIRIILNGRASTQAVKWLLEDNNIKASAEEISKISLKIKSFWLKNKREMSKEEFLAIAEEVTD